MTDHGAPPLVIGVDGGNSKTDLVLADASGRLLGLLEGSTISHQALGPAAARDAMASLLGRAAALRRHLGLDHPVRADFCLAGADTRVDVRWLRATIESLAPAAAIDIHNDCEAALRAGSDRGWGVAVIMGAGVNAAGIAPDGRRARLAALGEISGDRGGGRDIGWAAVAAAVRARDGRGPRTVLETTVPAHFGLHRPSSLVAAFYAGRVDAVRALELSPLVFAAAREGDPVARRILDEQADEIGAMAGAMLRRLHLTRIEPDVVLAGGIMRGDDPEFHRRASDAIRAVAPRATVIRYTGRPVVGATLLAIDALVVPGRARDAAAARLREALAEA